MIDGEYPFTEPAWHDSSAVLFCVAFVECRIICAGKLDFVRQDGNFIPALVANQ